MGLYDGLEVAADPAAPAAAPAAPKVPASMYDGLELAGDQNSPPREAAGALEAIQAGFQASAPGLAWRGRLPDLISNPEHSKWWERALTVTAQIGAELPIMAVGAAAGGAAGGAMGTAIAPGPGTAAGTIVGTGAGMFALPAAMRETLIQAYKSGEIKTGADFWNILREIATTTGKEAAIGAATMGAGSIAARTVGKVIAPSIGEALSVPAATKVIGGVDTAAQIATMVTMPAALQGRLPDAQEFLDAAVVIGGLKLALPIAARITNTFVKTGKPPAEQVADAQANPDIAKDLAAGPEPTGTAPPPLQGEYSKQEDLFNIQGRLGELEAKSTGTAGVETTDAAGNRVTIPAAPGVLFTFAEKQEYDRLKTKAAALEAEGVKPQAPAAASPEMATRVTAMAESRLTELMMKAETEPLTDTERAERIFLSNNKNNPNSLIEHYKLGTEEMRRGPTLEETTASAQKVYDDVLRQARDADQARLDAGQTPLGDDHAQGIATLVQSRMRAAAARLGRLPEEIYNKRMLQVVDAAAAQAAEAEAAIPPGAARFTPPEVDLFGEPVQTTSAPRYAVENLATQEIPLERLVLSKEVPQFKGQANEMGVIVPLGGQFDRTGVGPIQVWERTDGTLEVISGRHRLDLARRTGETTIPAQIHREAEGFTAAQAATLDAKLNIREEQGNVADYAQYFKASGITKEAADADGLLARAKGRTGYAIARDGSPDLLAAHRAGLLSDDAAFSISSAAPGSERLQALGIAMVNEGKSILMAVNTMKAVDLMAAEKIAAGQQGDIFGFDDSAMLEAAAMAKKASSIQRKIGEQISAVSGASRRPELARKMGVDVQDPEGIQKRIIELRQEQYLWDNWPLHPELVAKLREGALKQSPVEEFVLMPETPEELRRRNEEAVALARRKENQLSQAVGAPDFTVDQADLFNTQRTLFQSSREPFYSELARQIDASDLKAASPEQWRGTIKNMKGVKGGEINALQLNEWLAAQEGKVTKEQIAAYIKGNGLKVVDVKLGAEGEKTLMDAAIADDVKLLTNRGFSPEVNPEDAGVVGFNDVETGDMVGAAEMRAWMAGGEESKMQPIPEEVVAAAERVERYWAGSGDYLNPTKFSRWQLPGGKDYREAFITLPEIPGVVEVKHEMPSIPVLKAAYGWEIKKAPKNISMFKLQRPDNYIEPQRFSTEAAARAEHLAVTGNTLEKAGYRLVEKKEPAPGAWEITFRDGSRIYYDTEGSAESSLQYEWRKDNPKRQNEGAWADGHPPYGDIKNPIMRYRFNERTDAEGKRVMFLEELQPPVKSEFAKMPEYLQKNWLEMGLKRVMIYAAQNGFDKVSWTTGTQQVERYTGALRQAVDVIEWTKTKEGVQLVGFKGDRMSPGTRGDIAARLDAIEEQMAELRRIGDERGELTRAQQTKWDDLMTARDGQRQALRGSKVVDTTEKEDALSDAIGKAMADRILKDPAQTGTIEGENITIDKAWPAKLYDRLVPRVIEKIAAKLGGGKVGTTELQKPNEPRANIDISDEITRGIIPEFRQNADFADSFQGAEDFPRGTKKPLFAETKILVDGQERDAIAAIDKSGVHIITVDAGNEFMIPAEWYVGSGHNWETPSNALRAVQESWSGPEPWLQAEHIVGDATVGPFKPSTERLGTMTQQSIEITPAMREKALAGLPLFQQHRGSYDVAENLITIMQGADKSTVVHELWHSWLEEMKFDAARPDAPADIKRDWEILRHELAIPENGEISRASHEQFARSGERYLAEGQAPSVALRAVFERFKEWLLAIYRDIRNLNVQINPELRGVLDRMLATDQEIADAKELGVPRAYVAEARATEARKIVPGFKAEQISMQPYADELPAGPGEAPDNTHVNYAYINTPLDVKLTMQRLAEIDQAEIQRHRGGTEGVKSWAEANAEQAEYLNDVLGGDEDTLRILQPADPNAPKVDARLGIMKKLMVGAAKDSARLRDVVLEGGHDATVRQQLEYMGSIERARMLQAEFLGERAAVARALNALKDVTEGSGDIARMLDVIGTGDERLFQTARTPAEEQAFMRAKLDEIMQNYRGKTPLDIAKLHKEIGTLKGTFKFSKEITKATKWEMVVEGFKASILSGPVTHTTNMFGTEAFHQLRPAVDALAAVIGMARGASPGMGESDRASMSEAVARVTGTLGGLQDGLKVGYHVFLADEVTGKTESYRTAIPGRVGHWIRAPLRAMAAEDAIVTTMYARGELRTLAIRQAFDENMNPGTREFAERVDRLVDTPTPEMQVAAETAATRMTFNAPLGEKGVALQLFVNKWNLQWMIPFIRTPINIAKELARMSPFAPIVGEWRAAIAKGGIERDRALAELTLGSGIMAITMAYAFQGKVSGAGSPDPGKNRGKAGVWQPYSINPNGDKWYEYGRIQPTGTLMGLASDLANVWDHATDEEKDKIPKMLAIAFSNAVTNQTFLQGITNFVNAMSDPTRFAPRFLQGLAGSMVPNIIGQPTAMADPVVREVNGMLDAIQARIPGMRQTLLPKRDWLGEEVKTKERAGVVMPVREQPVSDDKVRLEAARLNLSMAAAPKKTHVGKGTGKLGEVELTPEERDTFEKVGGEFAHQILANVVNAEGYDAIPDLVKRHIFSKILTESHKLAATVALPMEKRLAYLQTITEKMTHELSPEFQR